jgi:hypothetical protein
VFDAVHRGVERGVLLQRDPVMLTNELWAVVHGLASLELLGCLGPPQAAEESWRHVISAMLAGLRPAPAVEPGRPGSDGRIRP